MKCPRCKMEDVYVSRRSSTSILSFMVVSLRCHRCCLLFTAPRWQVTAEMAAPPSSKTRSDTEITTPNTDSAQPDTAGTRRRAA